MQKPNELDTWLYDLMGLILYTKKSIGIMLRIRKPTNKYERKVMWTGLFEVAYNNSKVAVVIGLCIIFHNSRNQKRNFFKLFDLLSSNDFNGTKVSSKAEVLSTVELLKSEIEIHRDLIKELVNSRNKIYAHYDPDPSISYLEDEKLEVLVKLAVRVFNELCLKIYGDTYDLKITRFNTAEPVIKTLVRDYKNKLKSKQ